MRMLRLKEFKCFAKGLTANKGHDWKLNLVSVKFQHSLHSPAVSPQCTNPVPHFGRIYGTPFSQLNIPEIGMHFIDDSL